MLLNRYAGHACKRINRRSVAFGASPYQHLEDEDDDEYERQPLLRDLRAIKNTRQSAAVLAFVLKGLANGGESLS